MIRTICAVLLLLGLSTQAQARVLDVHTLNTHWERYTGKMVTLRGQIDACQGWYCEICPEDMQQGADSRGCATIVFEQNSDASLGEGYETEVHNRWLYRFATVTLTARFNTACIWDGTGKPVHNVVCSDGPASLEYARVLKIHGRKSARDGLATDMEQMRPLVPAAAIDADAMFAEFGRVMIYLRDRPHAMLSLVLSPGDLENKMVAGNEDVIDGVACVCHKDSCEGLWPTRFLNDMASPANPFHCWNMRKTAAGWRVIPSL